MTVYLVTWTEFGRGDEPIGIYTSAERAMAAVERHRKRSRVGWSDPWQWGWLGGRPVCFRWAESPDGWRGDPRRYQYMVTRLELDAT